MTIDENKQAILLLSTYFSPPKKGDPTILTPIEYGRFALWLKDNQFQPKDLFHKFEEIGRQWLDPKNKITVDRLRFLLGRGLAMGLALEKWQSAGIWVISRSDPNYPARLKKRLGEKAPAVLFGAGNVKLLNVGGLSIVGSRNIDEVDQQFTRLVSREAAMEGLNVISGGARGVDETSMLAALEVDGTAIGILANDLFKAVLASKWRHYIKAEQLVLVSPFYPEASFHVGNAMGRNKYIYCLADYALVVRSEEGSGGTWTGAIENRKNSWVPLFVKAQSNASGNIALIAQGALTLNVGDEISDAQSDWLLIQLKRESSANEAKGIEDSPPETIVADEPKTDSGLANDRVEEKTIIGVVEGPAEDTALVELSVGGTGPLDLVQTIDPYQQFLELIDMMLEEHSPITLTILKEARKDLKQKQITGWLDQASEAGLIERQGKNRAYIRKAAKSEQPDLFV